MAQHNHDTSKEVKQALEQDHTILYDSSKRNFNNDNVINHPTSLEEQLNLKVNEKKKELEAATEAKKEMERKLKTSEGYYALKQTVKDLQVDLNNILNDPKRDEKLQKLINDKRNKEELLKKTENEKKPQCQRLLDVLQKQEATVTQKQRDYTEQRDRQSQTEKELAQENASETRQDKQLEKLEKDLLAAQTALQKANDRVTSLQKKHQDQKGIAQQKKQVHTQRQTELNALKTRQTHISNESREIGTAISQLKNRLEKAQKFNTSTKSLKNEIASLSSQDTSIKQVARDDKLHTLENITGMDQEDVRILENLKMRNNSIKYRIPDIPFQTGENQRETSTDTFERFEHSVAGLRESWNIEDPSSPHHIERNQDLFKMRNEIDQIENQLQQLISEENKITAKKESAISQLAWHENTQELNYKALLRICEAEQGEYKQLVFDSNSTLYALDAIVSITGPEKTIFIKQCKTPLLEKTCNILITRIDQYLIHEDPSTDYYKNIQKMKKACKDMKDSKGKDDLKQPAKDFFSIKLTIDKYIASKVNELNEYERLMI